MRATWIGYKQMVAPFSVGRAAAPNEYTIEQRLRNRESKYPRKGFEGRRVAVIVNVTPARLLTLRLNQLLFYVTEALFERIERITRRKILVHDSPCETDLLCFCDEHRKIKVTMTDFSHKRRVVMLSRDPVIFHV